MSDNEIEEKYGDLSRIDSEQIRIMHDDRAKRLLSHKGILAKILHETVHEFKNIPVDVIKNQCIDTPIVSKESRENGDYSKGRNIESNILGEGKVFYDILFDAYLPPEYDINEKYKVIINLEAQNDNPSQYDLSTRGVYYCARMISGQKGKEFKKSDYNSIKKVYSIWICMKPPKDKRNTIEQFGMIQKNDLKKAYTDPKFYDKLEVIKLNLSNNSDSAEDGIIRSFDRLLSGINKDEKIKVLKEEFELTESEIEEEVDDMCNLSEYYYEKGEEQGIATGTIDAIRKNAKRIISCSDHEHGVW